MYINTLIKIKNAGAARKHFLKTRYTKIDQAILELLKKAGFINTVEVKGRSYKKIIDIELNPERPIKGVSLLSTPSRRQYAGYQELRKVKNGYGTLVISTSKGIMNGENARKEKVGGQLLFEVW